MSFTAKFLSAAGSRSRACQPAQNLVFSVSLESASSYNKIAFHSGSILAKGAKKLLMTSFGNALLLVENYSNSRHVGTVSLRAIFYHPSLHCSS